MADVTVVGAAVDAPIETKISALVKILRNKTMPWGEALRVCNIPNDVKQAFASQHIVLGTGRAVKYPEWDEVMAGLLLEVAQNPKQYITGGKRHVTRRGLLHGKGRRMKLKGYDKKTDIQLFREAYSALQELERRRREKSASDAEGSSKLEALQAENSQLRVLIKNASTANSALEKAKEKFGIK